LRGAFFCKTETLAEMDWYHSLAGQFFYEQIQKTRIHQVQRQTSHQYFSRKRRTPRLGKAEAFLEFQYARCVRIHSMVGCYPQVEVQEGGIPAARSSRNPR
jgi:hypothetical protein